MASTLMSNSMPVYRHTARTECGVFRNDSTRHLQFAVVYVGHVTAQEDVERRGRLYRLGA